MISRVKSVKSLGGACLLALLLLPTPSLAQAPQATLTLDPDGPVTVGTPVTVTATVLVPTFMPSPPVWPDLQIADAVTRQPDRATRPVTQRIGRDSWSGIARTWQIVPQRAADYDLGAPEVAITYADPGDSHPVTATLALPDVAFSATVPPGAEGIDPFLAATSLQLTARLDGLPAAPKPGDAVTLTLTAAAAGPPAILIPPLGSRLATPAGLRAYPREPVLADAPTATRTEAVTFVIEAPGTYVLPAVALDWWNTTSGRRETATTVSLQVVVPDPPGWGRAGAGSHARGLALAAALAALAALLGAVLVSRRRARPPSEARLYRALRRAIRRAPPSEIRGCLARWQAALPGRPAPLPALDAALRALERPTYGPPDPVAMGSPRPDLLAAVEAMRASAPARRRAALPDLNPVPGS